MRDQNRLKEKFQLSLDGRQVASVIVGALVILGGVFILGLNVGRQLGERERTARLPVDPLAALDAPLPPADAGEPPKLSYHEALTKDRPPEPAPPAPKPGKPSAAPAMAEVKPSPPAPPPPPSTAASTVPPAAAPSLGPVPSAPPAPSTSSEMKARTGNFAIQVGASQSLGEAQRIAERFKSHRPRIVSADIPGKGRWFRVKLGAFDSRSEAERYLQDLARETGARGFVTAFD